jgi:hypothetical protein
LSAFPFSVGAEANSGSDPVNGVAKSEVYSCLLIHSTHRDRPSSPSVFSEKISEHAAEVIKIFEMYIESVRACRKATCGGGPETPSFVVVRAFGLITKNVISSRHFFEAILVPPSCVRVMGSCQFPIGLGYFF